jgi:EAL domain-containing protein (putative c-di-GMP-specific phosphodiesterase class I)/ActR/RegA family two-component response regulator
MRILAVDDDAFALRLITHQLGSLGYDDVTATADAREALRALAESGPPFDVVLLDLQMPDIDGVEFVRHLADMGFQGNIGFVSAEDQRMLATVQHIAEAHRLRVCGALHKPVTTEQLGALLGAVTPPPARRSGRVTIPAAVYTLDGLAQCIADGALTNVYQPKVSLATGKVTGVETLVRLRHPQDGIVSPDLFVPLLEETPLIDTLTQAVLQGAVRQGAAWFAAGLPLHVGVNVSVENLSALDFPDTVARLVREAELPPRLLILEVTETRLMRDRLQALDILSRLRLKHIGLSIDDFGTGHSSLQQLRDIPFEELKVDRGFVHGASQDPAKRAILESSLALARQLGMRTVAEGVELLEDWQLLRQLGCDVAQGYFVARPMPPEEIPAWLAAWEQRREALVG